MNGWTKPFRSEEDWLLLKYEDVKEAIEEGDERAKTKLAWLKLKMVETDGINSL